MVYAKTEERNLRQHGALWYVRVAVPPKLRAMGWAGTVEEPLGTKDREEALRLRDPAVSAIRARFARARSGEELTDEEIELAALNEFARVAETLRGGLDNFEIDPKNNGLCPANEWLGIHLEPSEEGFEPDPSIVERDVERVLRETGAPAGPTARERLADSLVWAQVTAIRAALDLFAHLRGPEWQRPPQPERTALEAFSGIGPPPSVSLVAQHYQRGHRNWSPSTMRQFRVSSRLFADFVDDMPLAEVTRDHARAFLQTLRGLSSNYGTRIKGEEPALRELLARFPAEPRQRTL